MAYRNPFITSVIDDAEERLRVLAGFRHADMSAVEHGPYIHGIHRRGHAGSLLMEEVMKLADGFAEAGVTQEVCVTFAGEDEQDRVIALFVGGRFAVTTPSHRTQWIP